MDRVVDLTMPIEDHFRWKVERRLPKSFENGDEFQVTSLGFGVHGFTHIDTPRHMLPDGYTTSEIKIESLVRRCTVLDISSLDDNSAITADVLRNVGNRPRKGEIALIKTQLATRWSYRTVDYWMNAPYFQRDAAQWLLETGVCAVAFDFPQDYVIRELFGIRESVPSHEYVTHDILLRHGVVLIEYLHNTERLLLDKCILCALPLSIPQADGAPARVVAVDPEYSFTDELRVE